MNRNLFRRLGLGSAAVLALGLVAPASGGAVGPARPAPVAATDGRLVFNDYGTGQLYTANPDGSSLVQITHLHNTAAFAPRWSPDASHIAYYSFTADGARLYEIAADGSGRRLIADETAGYDDITPGYTPDGQRVVFSRCQPDPPGGCAIYSVAIDGTDRQRITRFDGGDRRAYASAPRVSPGGEWVSFWRYGWRGITFQTWLVRPDGTQAHSITPPRLLGIGANWAPNGRALYLQGGPQSGLGLHIFRVPVTGGRSTQITFTDWPNGDFNPSMSPSGARIAFISDRTHPDLCCQDLYVMNPDGSGQQLIETGLSLPGAPNWGTAPLQSGPSDQVPPLTPQQLKAGQERARADQRTWGSGYGMVGPGGGRS